jgi:hypothetical protein
MIAVVFRGEIAAREHQALLEAALVRDWKQAQTIMVSHIRGCVEHALKEDNAGVFGSPSKLAPVKALSTGSNTQSNRKVKNQIAKSARTKQHSAK